MWLIAEYQPTTLFTLKPANATSSGGKTLVVPTPFAVKMALLDAGIRTRGVDVGREIFPTLRDLAVAARPPDRLVVSNTFTKILRPHKGGPRDSNGAGLETPMGNTIAFREYVQFGGPLALAIDVQDVDADLAHLLERLLAQINYLGKRGGFMQLTQPPERAEALSDTFTRLNPDGMPAAFNLNGMLQVLDDCGPRMTFEHADIYSGKYLYAGRDTGRVLHHVVLPYRVARSSRGFTLYERVAG